jgi:hypothetical protein
LAVVSKSYAIRVKINFPAIDKNASFKKQFPELRDAVSRAGHNGRKGCGYILSACINRKPHTTMLPVAPV